MTVTALQIDRAEDIASRLEEALYHMHSAVEELEGAADSLCSDLVSTLRELIFSAESEKQSCDEVLAEADRQELAAMNSEYERSVL